MGEPTIEDYYVEDRTFPPSAEFAAAAHLSDRSHHDEAAVDYEAFWARQARELLTWDEDFHTTLQWDLPYAEWFIGGKLNLSANCLDRHVEAGHGDRIAYFWEGEPGDTRQITYAELLDEVSRFANVLKGLGLERGDRIAIYMPMILELPIAMLACTRIGVAHSVIFGGFSPDSIVDRCEDAEARLVITADAGYRRGAPSALKVNVDAALDIGAPSVEHVVVVNRCDTEVTMADGRDLWWHDLMADASPDCPAEPMDSEQLLYLLYTSGTTAKPKGIMHTTGGYLTQVAYTHRYVFDVRRNEDVYWCAADIGWVTGHSYIVYGPLTNGCTSVMYEGTPDTPRPEHRTGDRADWPRDRLWDIIERYGVTQLYTAPTAIRTFMKWGAEDPARHDLSSLRVLGTVGEPINPEAWMWYHEHIGGSSCPIVDTWWQTETGGHMISPMPGVTTTKPGSACHTIPGVFAELVDDAGNPVERGGGYLTITRPWPAMLRGIWGDPERYHDTYWSRFEGRYFAGDGAKVDDDGYLWLLGRVDDVMNVSGHRISTAEVESALVDHPAVAEAAVVGATDATTGQAIIGYVILRGGNEPTPELGEEVRGHVATKLGPIARPKAVFLVPDLPKTRSGKIMRRLLRDVAEGRDLGDTTTLADAGVVAEIRERAAESPEED
ncbi:MAG TPA: acetate--CoA ligase [Acidimicrobiales bacterium]|jgi:acetyl-CoA synthetase|nr:acetate--CoA ligase [Acidimicrobiales bacterium]MDP6241453.1 acetate--CoA ligase [Acidimicrobiales bacterium]MDP7125332.1 acetate--CoA ligase [Acidimicrobiales bacterium]MDP7352552.1 acetate--CoA ligase [Acidimicrobiales bacterium]MDP7508816.1 acetate--CoA ligase [Acidimicrobiales bacterium]|tara:strand:- start:2848 stop:4842 length:1995 start_codon:yes stop_codon:yes gene_type:complete